MDDTAMGLLDALGDCSNAQCADVPGSIENYYQCQQDFCSGQHSACMNQPGDFGGSDAGWGDPGTGTGNQTCVEIYEGVLEICIPAYDICASSCSNDDCVQGCKDDIEACIADEQPAAPPRRVRCLRGGDRVSFDQLRDLLSQLEHHLAGVYGELHAR
jgi:hypothetical protein